MSSFGEIVMEYVCPALGTVMATLMFFAPYQDLREAVRRGSLGILNPTPWAFMLGNCFGWVVYSILIQNLWVFFANAPGLLLSVWLNLGACKLLYQGHYSKEMRQAFAAYLEGQQQQQQQEQQKQQQQEQLHPLASSHPLLNDVDNATTPGQQLTKQLSSQRLLAAVALPDQEPPLPSHQRSPSAVVLDVVTELFTGPVMGPGHKRTLSQSVAEEFHLHPLLAAAVPPPPMSTDGTTDEENGNVNVDDVEHANANNQNDNKPSDDINDPITNDKGNTESMAVDNNDGNDGNNEQEDKAKPKHRRAPSATEALTQTVGEALSQAATAVTDFTKVVWDVTAQTTPAPAPHENMVLGIVVVWTAVVSALAFAEAVNGTAKELVVGIVTNCFLVFFYGAPLSTIVTVLKDGNSDSIHVPTMITNTMSSVFWAVYGLALGDWFIAAPNCVGSFLGAAQIVLSILYPRTTATLAPSKPKRRVKSATTGSTQAVSHWWHRTGNTTSNNDDAGTKKDNVVTFAMDQPKNTGRGSNHTDDSAHGAHPLSGGGGGMNSTDNNPKERDVEAVSINP